MDYSIYAHAASLANVIVLCYVLGVECQTLEMSSIVHAITAYQDML